MYSCSGAIKNWGWAKGSSVLSEIGTLHLEFQYLTHITGKQIYLKKVSSTCTVICPGYLEDSTLHLVLFIQFILTL